jgi:fructose-1,6-bisphosphatase II
MFYTHIPYMEKLIVGPKAARAIDITDTVKNNLRRIAKAEDRHIEDLTVVVLDRDRHEVLLDEIRTAGARVKLIMDGDVAAGVMAAMEHRTGIDVLMGIGGAPEAVLAACAIKCIGGAMQCRLWLRLGEDRCRTQSLVMRSYSGTIRYIDAEHSLAKLRLRREEAEAEGSPALIATKADQAERLAPG